MHKQTAELEKSNQQLAKEIDERKKAEDELRALSNRLINLQERERTMVATELHEQISQSLALAKLLLEKASKLPQSKALPRIKESVSLLQDIISQLRNLSQELRPSMLDNLGLLPALLWLFEWYGSRDGIIINFKENGLQIPVLGDVATAAYRIVQEALSNVINHANVNEITVSAYVKDSALTLRIQDRGKGFDPSLVSTSTGLNNMRERARSLGGRLYIKSTVGSGTTISCKLPLTPRIPGL